MAFICSSADLKYAHEINDSNNLISSKIKFYTPNPSYKVLKIGKNDSKVEYEILKSNCYTKNNIPDWININLFSINLNQSKSNIIYIHLENQIQTKILLKEEGNASSQKRKLILYSHENGTDLFRILPFLIDLSVQIKCDIISYDYIGFGRSNGKPTETNFLNSYQEIMDIILNKFNYQMENVLLIGRGIGVMHSIIIASRNNYLKCKGLILISPSISEKKIDINLMKRIICPTLLIISKDEEYDEDDEKNEVISFCREINNEKEWFPKDKNIYDRQSLFFKGDILLKHRKKFISFIREYMKSNDEYNIKSRHSSIATYLDNNNIQSRVNSIKDFEKQKVDNNVDINFNFNNDDY